jgi:hypothetical protein
MTKNHLKALALLVVGACLMAGYARCREIYTGYRQCQGEDRIMHHIDDMASDLAREGMSKHKKGNL